MLNEAKKALRVTAAAYDSEIASLLMAGAGDLEIAGVRLPGRVAFTVATSGTVTDASTLKDPLAEAYETQKVQLMHADGYTEYRGGDC